MKSLLEYIKEILSSNADQEHQLMMEMANIQRGIKFGKYLYTVAIHGPSSKDREYPHIHVYLTNDNSQKQFSFEISLIDILCNDEINLIRQLDKTKKKKLDIKNRNNCSWEGYSDIYDGFEKWLEEPYKRFEGQYKNNLDALIGTYNFEGNLDETVNSFLEYVKSQNKQIIKRYQYLFSDEDKIKYKECFK